MDGPSDIEVSIIKLNGGTFGFRARRSDAVQAVLERVRDTWKIRLSAQKLCLAGSSEAVNDGVTVSIFERQTLLDELCGTSKGRLELTLIVEERPVDPLAIADELRLRIAPDFQQLELHRPLAENPFDQIRMNL